MRKFVWRILVADFGGEICMADLYGGFWWGNFVWARILHRRQATAEYSSFDLEISSLQNASSCSFPLDLGHNRY